MKYPDSILFEDGLQIYQQLIDDLKPRMQVQRIGCSFEDRPIHALRWGSGPKKVFLWAQMHGDEPTGSAVLFSFAQLLEGMIESDMLSLGNKIRWRSAFSLYIIPVLNPDGAFRNDRFNAMGIDLNRDARTQAAPESQVLEEAVVNFRPDLAINLHDLSRVFSVGSSQLPATISFSAPAVRKDTKHIPKNRLKAMQLIYSTYCWMEELMPGHAARYSDIFEDRAFGETIQQKGIPVILIESGGNNDQKGTLSAHSMLLNAIIHLLQQFEGNSFEAHGPKDYYAIPELIENRFDILYPKARISTALGKSFIADVGMRKSKDELILEEIGDLADYQAYELIENASFKLEDLHRMRPHNNELASFSTTGKNRS